MPGGAFGQPEMLEPLAMEQGVKPFNWDDAEKEVVEGGASLCFAPRQIHPLTGSKGLSLAFL